MALWPAFDSRGATALLLLIIALSAVFFLVSIIQWFRLPTNRPSVNVVQFGVMHLGMMLWGISLHGMTKHDTIPTGDCTILGLLGYLGPTLVLSGLCNGLIHLAWRDATSLPTLLLKLSNKFRMIWAVTLIGIPVLCIVASAPIKNGIYVQDHTCAFNMQTPSAVLPAIHLALLTVMLCFIVGWRFMKKHNNTAMHTTKYIVAPLFGGLVVAVVVATQTAITKVNTDAANSTIVSTSSPSSTATTTTTTVTTIPIGVVSTTTTPTTLDQGIFGATTAATPQVQTMLWLFFLAELLLLIAQSFSACEKLFLNPQETLTKPKPREASSPSSVKIKRPSLQRPLDPSSLDDAEQEIGQAQGEDDEYEDEASDQLAQLSVIRMSPSSTGTRGPPSILMQDDSANARNGFTSTAGSECGRFNRASHLVVDGGDGRVRLASVSRTNPLFDSIVALNDETEVDTGKVKTYKISKERDAIQEEISQVLATRRAASDADLNASHNSRSSTLFDGALYEIGEDSDSDSDMDDTGEDYVLPDDAIISQKQKKSQRRSSQLVSGIQLETPLRGPASGNYMLNGSTITEDEDDYETLESSPHDKSLVAEYEPIENLLAARAQRAKVPMPSGLIKPSIPKPEGFISSAERKRNTTSSTPVKVVLAEEDIDDDDIQEAHDALDSLIQGLSLEMEALPPAPKQSSAHGTQLHPNDSESDGEDGGIGERDDSSSQASSSIALDEASFASGLLSQVEALSEPPKGERALPTLSAQPQYSASSSEQGSDSEEECEREKHRDGDGVGVQDGPASVSKGTPFSDDFQQELKLSLPPPSPSLTIARQQAGGLKRAPPTLPAASLFQFNTDMTSEKGEYGIRTSSGSASGLSPPPLPPSGLRRANSTSGEASLRDAMKFNLKQLEQDGKRHSAKLDSVRGNGSSLGSTSSAALPSPSFSADVQLPKGILTKAAKVSSVTKGNPSSQLSRSSSSSSPHAPTPPPPPPPPPPQLLALNAKKQASAIQLPPRRMTGQALAQKQQDQLEARQQRFLAMQQKRQTQSSSSSQSQQHFPHAPPRLRPTASDSPYNPIVPRGQSLLSSFAHPMTSSAAHASSPTAPSKANDPYTMMKPPLGGSGFVLTPPQRPQQSLPQPSPGVNESDYVTEEEQRRMREQEEEQREGSSLYEYIPPSLKLRQLAMSTSQSSINGIVLAPPANVAPIAQRVAQEYFDN
eukprot:m.287619 g.287619  ORF g.287619 m.287619 type:complete len:1208 (+) comp15791_c0_seq1:607-4230(+)